MLANFMDKSVKTGAPILLCRRISQLPLWQVITNLPMMMTNLLVKIIS